MNYLSYDIEIYEDLVDGQQVDLKKITPSVAAVCTNENDVQFFYDEPFMSKITAQRLVEVISDYYDNGYIPFTWNGLSFDFPLLGYYSGMIDQCAHLALNSVDAMFMVVANKGHNLGLDTALIGAGLETKTHHVKLK